MLGLLTSTIPAKKRGIDLIEATQEPSCGGQGGFLIAEGNQFVFNCIYSCHS